MDFWAKKWKSDPFWHTNTANHYLKSHFPFILKDMPEEKSLFRVFVPLCGKSYDLKWYMLVVYNFKSYFI